MASFRLGVPSHGCHHAPRASHDEGRRCHVVDHLHHAMLVCVVVIQPGRTAAGHERGVCGLRNLRTAAKTDGLSSSMRVDPTSGINMFNREHWALPRDMDIHIQLKRQYGYPFISDFNIDVKWTYLNSFAIIFLYPNLDSYSNKMSK